MRGIVLAWAAGLGLMTLRTVQEFKRPPVPGRILAASIVFAALALLAEYEPARRAAVLAAWGFDLAVLFQIVPNVTAAASHLEGSSSSSSSGGRAAGPPPPPSPAQAIGG